MNNVVLESVETFIEMLKPLDIDEKKFYDSFPPIRRGDPPVEVLNVHSVRLYASIVGIGIREGTTKIIKEPDLSDVDSDIVIGSYAECPYILNGYEDIGHRGYYAEITQKTHWPGSKDGNKAPRLNPNYRETAITRAERNAMLGLMPARYILFRIKQLSQEKAKLLDEKSKIDKARASARMRATMLEENGVPSIGILEEAKKLKGEVIEDWGVEEWRYLESEFAKAIAEKVPREPGDESIDLDSDAQPEVEVPPEAEELTEEDF